MHPMRFWLFMGLTVLAMRSPSAAQDEPVFCLTKSQLDFDIKQTRTPSEPCAFDIKYSGEAQVKLTPSIEGGDESAFCIVEGCNTTQLDGPGTVTVSVVFRPEKAKAYASTLVVKSDTEFVGRVLLFGRGEEEISEVFTRTYWVGGAAASSGATTGTEGGGALFGLLMMRGNEQTSGTFNFTQPSAVAGQPVTDHVVDPSFGSALLTPSTETRNMQFRYGKVGGKQLGVIKFGDPKPGVWCPGFYGRVGLSLSDWQLKDSQPVTSLSGALIQYSVGLQLMQPAEEPNGETSRPAGFGLEVGFAWRQITGDILQDDIFREKVFGTRKSRFSGWEVSAFIDLGSVRPFATYTSFRSDHDIRGFTGGQLIFGVQSIVPLFPANKAATDERRTSGTPEPFQPVL